MSKQGREKSICIPKFGKREEEIGTCVLIYEKFLANKFLGFS